MPISRHTTLALAPFILFSLGCEPHPENQPAVETEDLAILRGAEAPAKSDAENAATWLKKLEEKIPSEIKEIFGAASKISGVVGQATAGWDTAKLLLAVLSGTKSSPTMSLEFKLLIQELNRLAGTLAHQNSQIERERIEARIDVVMGQVQRVANLGGLLDAHHDSMAEVAVRESANDTLFQRLFVHPKELLFYVPAPRLDHGFVYDWRIGYPTLLLNTALRLIVMRARDPNFAGNDNFDVELTRMIDQILRHWGRMQEGIQCGKLIGPYMILTISPDLRDQVRLAEGITTTRVPTNLSEMLLQGSRREEDTVTRVTCVNWHTSTVLQHDVIGGGSPYGAAHARAAVEAEKLMRQQLLSALPGAETADLVQKIARLRN